MGSGIKAQIMTGIRAQRKGLRAQKNGIRDHTVFKSESGIRFITRSKNLLSQYLSHNKVSVHRISWPRYITYSCFWLAAVPGIGSPGCLTKTWYHILNLLIVEGTVIWISSHFSPFVTQPLNALSTLEGRESDLYIVFCARNGEEEKGQKEILWQRKVRKYFLDWFTSGKRVQA